MNEIEEFSLRKWELEQSELKEWNQFYFAYVVK